MVYFPPMSSKKLKKALERLSSRAEASPEDGITIRRALAALKSEMEDTLGIIACSEDRSSKTSVTSTETHTNATVSESQDFGNQLIEEFNLDKSFKLKDLRTFASEIGTKHGLFPTIAERRSKVKLLKWLHTNRETLEPDFSDYLRKLGRDQTAQVPPLDNL